ncbi:MAG: efflux RND transporter periplasmic adaptor subunit [Verrucomicrobiota bacterium]
MENSPDHPDPTQVSDTTINPSGNRTKASSTPGQGPLIVAMDLLLMLNERTEHQPAVMEFVNEIAFHFKASRVALGWWRGESLKVIAISHTHRIESRMTAVRDLEKTMIECTDQAEVIYYPPLPEDLTLTREHELYANKHSANNLVSIPLEIDQEVYGVLMLQRENRAFSETEGDALQLIANLATRRIDELDRHGRRWWNRSESTAKEWLAKFLGPQKTWYKAIGIAIALLLAFLLFWPLPYRIKGDFTLKTQALVNIPAPYDGFIQSVHAQPGDEVESGADLVKLHTAELRLKESEILANLRSFSGRAEMAQGQGNTGEYHVALAEQAQSTAKLAMIRADLARASLQAPFEGIITEGKLREQIGGPVKQGDILMKMTRMEDLYFQIEIPEKDIQEVISDARVLLSFTSRPEDKYYSRIDVIEPAAVPVKENNVFFVRCPLEGEAAEWWRPGMTGVARVEAGTRSPLYLLTHRLIDFIRLKLWI